MRVIKGFNNTYQILQALCAGTPDSLLILYGQTECVQPGVAVIHRERSEESYDDLNELKKDITNTLIDILDWEMFDNIFLHGNFESDEIEIIKQVNEKYQNRFCLTVTEQVWDNDMENKVIIEEV